MSMYISKHLQAIQEVYFGKTPGIQKIQKQLSIFRSKYISGNIKDKFNYKINSDPELIKLNRMFEEEFGFETFALKIINQTSINAMTIPIGTCTDVWNTKKNLISNKDGFKYDKSAGYCCIIFIYSGIMCNNKFSDREALAIILHEIGHNFQGAVVNSIGIIENAFKLLMCAQTIVLIMINPQLGLLRAALEGINTTDNRKYILNFDSEMKKNNKKFSYFLSILWTLRGIQQSISNEFDFIKQIGRSTKIVSQYAAVFTNVANNKIKKIFENPIKTIMKLFGYQKEQFSDNFAVIYGYGPDLSSGVTKLQFVDDGIIKEALNKIPILSQLFNLIYLPIEILITMFDEHPVTPARLKNELRLLESELNKEELDPKMKKKILSDIDKINKVFDSYINATNQLPSDPYIFKKIYFTWLFEMGGDVKHLIFTSGNEKNIDNGYEQGLKNVKLK